MSYIIITCHKTVTVRINVTITIIITHSECGSVTLVSQHVKRMRPSILSSVASQTLSYFSTLSHTRHDFRQKLVEHKTCLDFLYNFCVKRFSF